MNIIIIGTGNVATVLGRKILSAEHRIVQVFSRNRSHATSLANILQAKPISAVNDLDRSAGLILISVPDGAYESFARALPHTDSFVVHTAGAVPLHVLRNTSNRYGVLYPLQSFRKELETVPEFPLLTDANEPAHLQELNAFAASLSNTVIPADDETRLKYHVSAVTVSNFTNHLFTLAEDWCKKEGLAFSLLQPLIQETVNRIGQLSPAGMQTGPAIRNDIQTMEKHRQLLNQYPGLLQLYEAFTTNIQQFHNNK